MNWRAHGLCLGSLALLGACAGPAIGWPDRRRPEDPLPSGPPRLRSYKEAYFSELGDRFVGHLTRAQLLEEIAAARVLFLGDRHDDLDLHDHTLVLLDELHRHDHRPWVIGLEAVGTQDQRHLDAYGRGDEDTFALRSQIARRWPNSWLDNPDVDSGFYCALVERGRQWQAEMFALEPTPRLPLEERDEFIGKSIATAAAAQPDALVVVVVGHTHLLGEGRLIERVGLPAIALGAEMSVTLREQATHYPAPVNARFWKTSSGVILWR